jgi:hypothetical protein
MSHIIWFPRLAVAAHEQALFAFNEAARKHFWPPRRRDFSQQLRTQIFSPLRFHSFRSLLWTLKCSWSVLTSMGLKTPFLPLLPRSPRQCVARIHTQSPIMFRIASAFSPKSSTQSSSNSTAHFSHFFCDILGRKWSKFIPPLSKKDNTQGSAVFETATHLKVCRRRICRSFVCWNLLDSTYVWRRYQFTR